MTTTKIGNKAPDFRLPATGDKEIRLKDLRGQRVVLYFYPKDDTPGCTSEGHDFQEHLDDFEALDTLVLGVSRDSVGSHEKFREKQGYSFDLVSDPDEKACRAYDVIREKNMYGRKVMGVERSTFLIDETGTLRAEWRKVKVKGHVDEVLEAVRDIAG